MKKRYIFLIIGASVIAVSAVFNLVGWIADGIFETKTYDLSDRSFESFNFDIKEADVELIPSIDGSNKVVWQEHKKYNYDVKVESGVLKLTQIKKHVFNMYNNSHDRKLCVYLPASSFDVLNIVTGTADVKVPGDFSFKSAKIEVATGDVEFKANVENSIELVSSTGDLHISDLGAKSLTIISSTGDQKLTNLVIAEDINLKCSTGKTVLTNVKGKNLKSISSTGKLKLTNTIITNSMDITKSTGDVIFEDSDAETIKVKTSTGDVKGTILTNKIFYVKTNTGKVDFPKSTIGGLCDIETSTGDVKISIKND